MNGTGQPPSAQSAPSAPSAAPVVYEEVPEVDAETATKQMVGLRDIAIADPVSWRPQTAGWYIVLALALAALALLGWKLLGRWRARAYRRRALVELDRIEQLLTAADERDRALRAINELVKRVRLSDGHRPDVAALSGTPWLAHLDRTWSGARFTANPGLLLAELPYDADGTIEAVPEADLRALTALVRQWIRAHHA